MCTLDLTKAFDVMNHHGLFIKVTERALPEKVLENWFNIGVAYIKQGNTYSLTFFGSDTWHTSVRWYAVTIPVCGFY